MKNKINISILLITLVVTIFSCSKARIEKPIDTSAYNEQNLMQFAPLDNYFLSKQTVNTENVSSEFHYPFNSSSLGTTFVSARPLIYPNGDTVKYPDEYPVTCNILEINSINNYIYYEKEPVISNKLLSCYLILKLKIHKNSEILKLVSIDLEGRANSYFFLKKHSIIY